MSAANQDVKVLTVASCSNVRAEHRSHVVVSGSYGGRYNAFNAAKWPVRAVIMNDAGIGRDNAGIVGLDFLDQIGLAAATADARTCHMEIAAQPRAGRRRDQRPSPQRRAQALSHPTCPGPQPPEVELSRFD